MSILHWNYVENNKRKVSIQADGDSDGDDDDDDDDDDAGQQEDDHPQPLGQAEARGVRPWEALRGGADGQVVSYYTPVFIGKIDKVGRKV